MFQPNMIIITTEINQLTRVSHSKIKKPKPNIQSLFS